MRLQLSSKESRWCSCGNQILTSDMRFIDSGVHICFKCRKSENKEALTFWRRLALGHYN